MLLCNLKQGLENPHHWDFSGFLYNNDIIPTQEEVRLTSQVLSAVFCIPAMREIEFT
jgi:hypothetical protein